MLAVAEAIWVLGTVYDLYSSKLAKAIEMLLGHSELVLQDLETVDAALQMAIKAGHLNL